MAITEPRVVVVDYKLPKQLETIRFLQYDTNGIKFVIENNGEEADLSNLTKIAVNFRRPDKKVISQELEAEENVITYQLTDSEMLKPGTCELVLHLYDDEERLTIAKFKVIIDENIEDGSTPTIEESRYIVQLLEEARDSLENVQGIEAELEGKRDKSVKIKGTDLDTSTDENKIKLINLADEVQQVIPNPPKVTFTSIGWFNVVWGTNHTNIHSLDINKLTVANTGNDTAIIQLGSHSYFGATNKHMYNVSDYTIISKSENVTMAEPKISQKIIPSLVGRNINISKINGPRQSVIELTIPAGAHVEIEINYMGFIFEEDGKDEFTNETMKVIYLSSNLSDTGFYHVPKALLAKQADTAFKAIEADMMASKWKNKVMVSYGDSITENAGWQDYLVSRFGLVHVNKGIGGTTASGNNANAGWQDVRINSFPANVDLITIMFGTNDWSESKAIGTDDGDTETYMGALGLIIRKLVTKYPMARIVLMAPPFRTDSVWDSEEVVIPYDTNVKDMKKYAEAVQYLAWKYGCKFVNMWAEMGINQINFKSFLENEQWPVHLNANGKKRFAEVMIGKLAEIEPLD